jgi:phage terminase small subunit
MTKLTNRQRRFIEELPRCKSLAEAARRAGYSSKFAGQAGYLALQRIGQKAPELLENIEITLEELIEKSIKPGLEATKTIHITYQGKITAEFVQPDWHARLEMAKLCLRLHGAYSSGRDKRKSDVSGPWVVLGPSDDSGTR